MNDNKVQVQVIDMFKPIMANKAGPAPVFINAVVTPSNAGYVGGIPSKTQKIERYVLLSAMPDDLRRRIETAIEAIMAGG